jgi:hypothetical protein
MAYIDRKLTVCFTKLMPLQTTREFRIVAAIAALLLSSACAALQPPNVTGPRGVDQLYPIRLTEDSQRREANLAALHRLAQSTGSIGATQPELQPVTSTILSLPDRASGALQLPKVGAGAVMNEEETRESLRRFIRQWQELIGSDPAKLSLVERIDNPDGSKLANYEQRPFRYPIRGNYGKLQIKFTSDRRVLNLTSSCIPDAERIQSSFSSLGLRPRAEETIKQLREKGLTYADAAGNRSTFTIAPSTEIVPRGMTIYVLPSAKTPDTLEFHLAWEMELTNGPVKLAYIDPVSGETIATA